MPVLSPMTIRAVRLRAVLLPLGVAFLSIAALGWYGLVRIPAQERYLNERNLRILRTRGAQLKAKVDNFDRAIDHALESYHAENVRSDQLREWLDEYVRLFSKGDLEIRNERPNGWSVVREPHLVCPGCHSRTVVPEGKKEAKCHECGRTYPIDWKDAS